MEKKKTKKKKEKEQKKEKQINTIKYDISKIFYI
jgi:hypothetical protein